MPRVVEPAGILLGRCLLAALFLHEAYAKIMNYDGAVIYSEAFGIPGFLLPPAILLELAGGAMIIGGAGARLASLGLAGFCLITAVLFHRNFGDRNQLLHFEKDFAIAGGLLLLAVRGPGNWALDRRWRRGQSGD